ncbi:GNAT family N-acetyltransferase [Pradoshia eiseniae]|uniref:GNAT family N-acetyltransferase n=1 Tax=Pradoshia eiseniae TaxID=2064768 RepID=UPI00137521E1|nr:GNAT family N-acetyltransferase [Pradoshia eiseniae]
MYKDYRQIPNRKLFGCQKDSQLIGCIGGEQNSDTFIIRHIAVTQEKRGCGVGSSMIQFILNDPSIKTVIAETDKEAVSFYRKFGFHITSLGEKYPGVERFACQYTLK